MSTLHTAKPRKSSTATKGRVKIDQEEDKLKVDRDKTKENSDSWGIRIPPGFDPNPMIALRTASVKKDEPSDDHGGVEHEDKKLPTNVKPENTKQEPTKREIRSALSPARLWEHDADGRRFIPGPGPMRNKYEDVSDVVDPPDYFEQENLPQDDQDLPPPPSPLHSPQHSPQPQPRPLPSQRQPQPLHRDGRPLPEVEVMLPRLEDVRRRQAARAFEAAQERQQQRELADADQTARQDSVFIKPEPEDDVKPLLALEEHDPAEARDVLRTAVQNLRNPAAKVKKELLLDDEFLLDALTWEGINHKYPIPLPKAISEFPFKREYIGHLYGGNHQETFPTPRPEMLDLHGLRDWMFLSLDFNPHAPTRPGHSGLFFDEDGQATDSRREIKRTFVRVKSGAWVYMGQYKMSPGISLSTDLWKAQASSVRRTWAKGILRAANWGTGNCVRIWLRKQRGADYEVTKEDYGEHKSQAQLQYIRSQLTEEDVIGAFDRGEEEMGTYRMTCVGYEAEFVDVLVRNVPGWVVFDKEMKAKRREVKAKRKAKEKGKGKQTRKAKGAGTKRKPIKIDSESESEEDGDGAVKMEVKAGSDDDYPGMSGDLPSSSTGRPRRAAAMVKRQRTS